DPTATNTTIGGTTAAVRNVISANSGAGILFQGASGNLVQGNFIGTDRTGGAKNNVIGGTVTGAGNTIANSTGAGITVDGATSTGNALRQNLIFGNGGAGIVLANGGN